MQGKPSGLCMSRHPSLLGDQTHQLLLPASFPSTGLRKIAGQALAPLPAKKGTSGMVDAAKLVGEILGKGVFRAEVPKRSGSGVWHALLQLLDEAIQTILRPARAIGPRAPAW